MIVSLLNMNSGFSDRLRPITYGIMLSRVFYKKNKSIQIFERKTKECPFLFTNLCKIKKFKIKKLKNINKKAINYSMNPFNSELTEKNLKKHMPFKFYNSKKNLEIWKNSYKLIYPNKRIQKKIDKLKLPKNYLSVHIRATDKVVSFFSRLFEIPSKSSIIKIQLNLFIKLLPKIINKNSNLKNIYLACDDKKIKEMVFRSLEKNNFKVHINKSKFNEKKMRQTSGDDFIVDLFCLSNSKKIISSTGGGVPYTAKLLANKKIEIVNYIDQKNIFFLLKFINYVFYKIVSVIRKIK